MMKNISILGAGNVGLAMAGHLGFKNHNICLYNRTPENLLKIKNCGGIQLKGVINEFIPINSITSNLIDAISGSDIIFITTPALAHKEIAKKIAPFLEDNQIIVLCPGRTFGCLEFYNNLMVHGLQSEVIIGETQTVMYTTRNEIRETDIFAIKKRVGFSSFPSINNGIALKTLNQLYPELYPMANILETGINNVGCLLHPIPTLLNTGWIETSKSQFKYYYDGITPSIAKYIEIMDVERISIGKKLGVKTFSLLDWLKESYEINGSNLYEAIHNNKAYYEIDAPITIQHRYILEDIPTGLVPLASLANKFGSESTLMNLTIDLASKILGINFKKEGRSLENLNINSDDPSELLNFLKNGIWEKNGNNK